MELITTKIANANLYKVYTAEENTAERRFVAMFDAANEDELIALIPTLTTQENDPLRERYFLNPAGVKVGKMNYVDGTSIEAVYASALSYAQARKLAID